MEDVRDLSMQEKENLAGDVMDSLGEPRDAGSEVDQSHDSAAVDQAHGAANDPLYVQKRLKQQQRRHEREIREMQARMAEMQYSAPVNQPNYSPTMSSPNMGNMPMGGDEQIRQAVAYALNHRDEMERKAREAESASHLNRQYQELSKHLDRMGDKYDDFDDVVLARDASFTPAMRDYALTLPKNGPGSAGEVLYKLGKNPQERDRIAKLHPVEQAAEMAKLSHALISGGEKLQTSTRPLGSVKNTPANNSHFVSENTPISSIRERMKSGAFK
jgi:hypothetical protein